MFVYLKPKGFSDCARLTLGFLGGSDGKEPPAVQETQSRRSLEKGMTTHSSILAWRISWTEEPGGLQSTGLQRVRCDSGGRMELWNV